MQGAARRQGVKGSAKKRKSPETITGGGVIGGKPEGKAAPLQEGEAEDASARLEANGSPKEQRSSPGRKGLASLFGTKVVMK